MVLLFVLTTPARSLCIVSRLLQRSRPESPRAHFGALPSRGIGAREVRCFEGTGYQGSGGRSGEEVWEVGCDGEYEREPKEERRRWGRRSESERKRES